LTEEERVYFLPSRGWVLELDIVKVGEIEGELK
jgi:hypothetical protein